MIIFEGRIDGKAEKHFFKRGRTIGHIILSFAFASLLPIVFWIWFGTGKGIVFWGYCIVVVIAFLTTFIPKSKKEKFEYIPTKIYVEDEFIVCVSPSYTESRLISAVKRVDKYDEFYELVFSIGNLTEKFVCQKNLLKAGSLEEFESLFDCPIVEK